MRAQPRPIRRTPVRMHAMGYRRSAAGGSTAGYLRNAVAAESGPAVASKELPKRPGSGAGGAWLFGLAGKKMVGVVGTLAVVAGTLCYGRGAVHSLLGGVGVDERVRVAIASGDDAGALQWLN